MWGNVIIMNTYLNNITKHQVFSAERQFLSLTDNGSELGHHVLEGFHDLGRLAFLVVREDAGHDNDRGQYDSKVQVVISGFFNGTRLKTEKVKYARLIYDRYVSTKKSSTCVSTCRSYLLTVY